MYDLSADLGNVVMQPRKECSCLCYSAMGPKRGDCQHDLENFANKKLPLELSVLAILVILSLQITF